MPQLRCCLLALFLVVLFGHTTRVDARPLSESIAEVLPANSSGDSAMGYRYYLPEGYDPSIEYPLVVYFHGSGQRGTDNSIQITQGPSTLFSRTKSQYPAIMLVPQLPDSLWTPYNPLDRTDEILEIMLNDFSIDTDRIYATGLSLGGFGTMSYLEYYNAENPDMLRFAAAAPTAGAYVSGIPDGNFSLEVSMTPETLAALQETPIWISHGDSDPVVPTSNALQTFNALAERPLDTPFMANLSGTFAGGPAAEVGNVRYIQYPNTGHNSWSRHYQSLDVYDWMFSKSLNPVPEPTTLTSALICLACASLKRSRKSR